MDEMKYNFEVVLELKDTLTKEERKKAINEIELLLEKWQIKKLNENTYVKKGTIKDYDDFGNTAFFYFELKEIKEYFKRSEYFDFWTGGHKIAV